MSVTHDAPESRPRAYSMDSLSTLSHDDVDKYTIAHTVSTGPEACNAITCSICYMPLNITANYSATPCGHVSCFTCIAKWMAMGKTSCPSCRTPLFDPPPVNYAVHFNMHTGANLYPPLMNEMDENINYMDNERENLDLRSFVNDEADNYAWPIVVNTFRTMMDEMSDTESTVFPHLHLDASNASNASSALRLFADSPSPIVEDQTESQSRLLTMRSIISSFIDGFVSSTASGSVDVTQTCAVFPHNLLRAHDQITYVETSQGTGETYEQWMFALEDINVLKLPSPPNPPVNM